MRLAARSKWQEEHESGKSPTGQDSKRPKTLDTITSSPPVLVRTEEGGVVRLLAIHYCSLCVQDVLFGASLAAASAGAQYGGEVTDYDHGLSFVTVLMTNYSLLMGNDYLLLATCYCLVRWCTSPFFVPPPPPFLRPSSPLASPSLASLPAPLHPCTAHFNSPPPPAQVHGSGHMVPTFRPRAALQLIAHVVQNSPFAPDVPELGEMSEADFDSFLDRWVDSAKTPAFVRP